MVEVIRLTGSDTTLIHRPLAEMDEETRQAMRFHAQSWRYDDTRLRAHLDFHPSRTWQETVAEVLGTV